MLEPADKKLTALASERGIDHPDIDAHLGKILRLNAIDVGILIVAIWAMVAKPML